MTTAFVSPHSGRRRPAQPGRVGRGPAFPPRAGRCTGTPLPPRRACSATNPLSWWDGPLDLFHPDELGLAQQAHEALRQSSVSTVITHRLRAKDGTYLWFECSVRAIRDPGTGEVQEIHR
ncbi:MAG: PAS domain-containing protein [Gemmatimonadetes bacterium]|nr:PAS domain-containing protein [Gemmatimonadota bacterium]